MTDSLDLQERVMFRLRSLYDRWGYTRYKMNKFEEYDLYARNKDFLISDSAITFTDTNGKLMALKPDVTLSIVKNSRDGGALQKLYYNENVYRVSKSTRSFRELMQVGLECLGDIDDYCICEVLELAARSLGAISEECVLSISHLGLLSELLDALGIPAERKGEALGLVGQKNFHELACLCRDCGVTEEKTGVLQQAMVLCGPPSAVLPRLKELLRGVTAPETLSSLERITGALADTAVLRFDLSVVDDIHYYNGIVFKGFIRGLPGSVLSGGQYDNLMRKMGRSAGAVGFAVYMDALERLDDQRKDYDVDTVVLYDGGVSLETLRSRVRERRDRGESVLVQRTLPENIRCRRVIRLGGDGE